MGQLQAVTYTAVNLSSGSVYGPVTGSREHHNDEVILTYGSG